jgi:hypothetical protein
MRLMKNSIVSVNQDPSDRAIMLELCKIGKIMSYSRPIA